MPSPAIEVQALSKRYLLGDVARGADTLRDAVSGMLRRERSSPAQELWALRDVDLEIRQGEVVGLVGRNGAGKSTLLKILARITEPTEGVARMRGRVGALLEVGTGFHPELSGRENVYLNGAILGMSRRDVRRRFDEIVAFSGVERFIDTPLKRYSSGMHLRLAFAVAAHMEPDIVVVDEVLAVGDAEFQQRCLGRMADLHDEGRTVVFVSHDDGAIASLCRRVVWLDGGRVREDGPTDEVLEHYLDTVQVAAGRATVEAAAGGPIRVLGAHVGVDEAPVRRRSPLRLAVTFTVVEPVPALDVALYLRTATGVRVLDEAWSDVVSAGRPIAGPGTYEVALVVPPVLASGHYVLGAWFGTAFEELLDQELLGFDLLPDPADRSEAVSRARVVQPEVTWEWSPVTARAPAR